MKYLIAGLGNIGAEYEETRHNIGFKVVDAFAQQLKTEFSADNFVDIAEGSIRGRKVFIIKPTTYMNVSGKAVNYWLQQLKIPLDNLMVVVDDLALPFGTVRLRAKGSDAGHNGLSSINEWLHTQNYARMRFGIGNDFPKGRQVDYVLGKWNDSERKLLSEKIALCCDALNEFVIAGISPCMNKYNNK